MSEASPFRVMLKTEFEQFNRQQLTQFPRHETVDVDIHCHDFNSDVPDERLGRLLRLPETWTPTEEVRTALAQNGVVPLTITNHNNGRSCFDLLDKGVDVLVGAEFTCFMPDYEVSLHVLTYGFTPQQEAVLNSRRRDLYRFLEYAVAQDLVTVLAHPLFCYGQDGLASPRYLEKLTLLFDNFEVINGQRDAWQNLLMAAWLEQLDEERVHEIAAREQIEPTRFCKRPVKKAMTGGSDCHMALFSGTSGTRFHVPELAARRGTTPLSALVLESLKAGRTAPFGRYVSEEKLTTAVLAYFCQAVLRMPDPGLVRLLLHKGETQEKLIALGIANAVMELRRHNYTTQFLGAFHNALTGKRPGFLLRRKVPKHYRPLVAELDTIAKSRRAGPDVFDDTLRSSLPKMFNSLDKLLAERIISKVETHKHRFAKDEEGRFPLIDKMEMPAYLRTLIMGSSDVAHRGADRCFSLLDGLPFPALFAFVLGGAHFVSAHVMFKSRPLLNAVSESVGRFQHPRRVLWLTDTFNDKNGVCRTLNLVRDEVARRGLPVDFAVVSEPAVPKTNVVSLKPLAAFPAPYYNDQKIVVPDLIELHKVFVEGGYDRIICSTEGPMSIMALYLKHAFSVPAYFYLHTDWLAFANRALALDGRTQDRVRRVLRALYQQFDGVFVLSRDQAEATEQGFSVPKETIFKTDHWVEDRFRPRPVDRTRLLEGLPVETPIVIYAGRVSREKGVAELPEIMRRIRATHPTARLMVCGDGPALTNLQCAIPDGIFLGWVDDHTLSYAFNSADVMVFPSTFDTFGNVLVEANACGLPAVAYAVKGPKDIITHGKNGFLATNLEEMAAHAARILSDSQLRESMGRGALECAAAHQPEAILDELLSKVGLPGAPEADAPLPSNRQVKAS